MTDSDISTATASTYTLTQDDVGNRIKLRVTFTDDDNFPESVTSAATGTVVAVDVTRRLLWIGTLTGGTHGDTVGFATFAGAGELSPASFDHSSTTYAVSEFTYDPDGQTVYFNISPSLAEVDIDNWTVSPSTALTRERFGGAADVSHSAAGTAIEVEIYSASASRYAGWNVGTEHTVTLEEALNLAPTGEPTITGTVQAGETLTADVSNISDPNGDPTYSHEYRYEWIRVDTSDDGTIIGTNSSTYNVVPDDVGKTIKVKVSFEDKDDFSQVLTSAATGIVLGSGTPGVSLNPTTLTVDEGLTATYTVVLDNQPTTDVIINITPGGGLTVDKATLTFGTTTWDTVQTVTVTAPEDIENTDDEMATITHAVATSAAEYRGVSVEDLEVTVADTTVFVSSTVFQGTGVYRIGGSIVVLVSFFSENLSWNVTVTGTPQLELDIGGQARQADYLSGTGSQVLIFRYRVVEDDLDTNGVSIGANKLTGTFSKADGTPGGVLLSHPARPDDSDQRVDGVRPTPVSAATTTDGSEINITFSERLDPLGPALGDLFTLKVNGSEVPNGITTGATRPGSVVILTLASNVTVGQVVAVSYEDPTTENEFAAVQDRFGNDADSFTDFPVTNNALHVVTIAAVTSSVDEGDAVQFTLTRSGTPATGLTVNVSVSEMGNFIMGTAPATVAFAGTETTAILSVDTDNDSPDERDGYVKATVTTDTAYIVGSPSSDMVTVLDDDIVPPPPQNLTARSGDEQVQLLWEPPAERAVDNYQYRYQQQGNNPWEPGTDDGWSDIPDGDASTRRHTVENLTNDLVYTFEVRAVNPAGDGEAATVTATPGRVVLREPFRFAEGEVSTLTITPKKAPFDSDQTLTLVLAGSYHPDTAPSPVAGQDFTVSLAAGDTLLTPQTRKLTNALSYNGLQPHYTLTLPANQESVAVKVTAIDDAEPEWSERMIIYVFRDGQQINRADFTSDNLYILASDQSPLPMSAAVNGATATVTFTRAVKQLEYGVYYEGDNPPAEEMAFLLFTGAKPTFERPHHLPTPAAGQPEGVYTDSFSVNGRVVSVTFPQAVPTGTRAWFVYDKIHPDGPLGDGSGSPYGFDVSWFIIEAINSRS